MKGKLLLVIILLASAVFLCGAAQAEIRVNEFPGFDAIPEHFDLLADGMPSLPSAKIEPDGTIIVTGLKDWEIDQEVMIDWVWYAAGGLYPASSETYDDKIVIRAEERKSNEYIAFRVPETEDCPTEMDLMIGNAFNSDDPAQGEVTVRFRYKADGTMATCEANRTVLIEKEDEQGGMSVQYSESGDFICATEMRRFPDGYGRLGDYLLARETDCLTGKQFESVTVTGEVEPDAMQICMAGEAIPRKVKILTEGKLDFKEGDPALPVLDPLPENALPEVWPAEYPDSFPEFSCEVKDGKTIWTIESLTGWGARVNIPGETYLMGEDNRINYYWHAYTMDEVPEDRFRVVSEAPDGFFQASVETERGPYWMEMGGEVQTDSEGNPDPWLGVVLEIQENRDIEVRYVTNGKTGWKEISMPVDGKMVTGVYGEDNRLQQTIP
ncbi:MAG: hypothetical protein J6Y48_14835 [Clostridia bacterium]|nr:hypothetical protein [Clostridia bacterium]